jgi:hypothetical protein
VSRLSLNKRLLIHKIRWYHNLRLLELSSSLTVAGAYVRNRLRLIFLVLSLFLLLLERSSVVYSCGYNSDDGKSASQFMVSDEALGSSEVATSAMGERTSSVSASIEATFILASPSLVVSVFVRSPPWLLMIFSKLRSCVFP